MQGRGVGQIANSGFSWEYLPLGTVNFGYSRCSDFYLTKLDLERVVFDLDRNLSGLVNYRLKSALYELVV